MIKVLCLGPSLLYFLWILTLRIIFSFLIERFTLLETWVWVGCFFLFLFFVCLTAQSQNLETVSKSVFLTVCLLFKCFSGQVNVAYLQDLGMFNRVLTFMQL